MTALEFRSLVRPPDLGLVAQLVAAAAAAACVWFLVGFFRDGYLFLTDRADPARADRHRANLLGDLLVIYGSFFALRGAAYALGR